MRHIFFFALAGFPQLSIADVSDFQGLSIEKIAVSGPGGMTEGPAALSDGSLLFSDLNLEKVFHLSREGKLSEFLSQTRRINGLMADWQDRVYACETRFGNAALVRFDYPSKKRVVLADRFDGKPFNVINDCVVDRSGGVYFSDIREGDDYPQETAAVYYLSGNRMLSRVIDDVETPNGVILSRDERHLFVAPTREGRIVRYDVIEPGVLGKGETFYTFDQVDGQVTGGDGMALDVNGNFYFAHFRGRKIDIVDPQGRRLAEIPLPANATNCSFGGPDGRTLYITSGNAVYAAAMNIPGHEFPGRR